MHCPPARRSGFAAAVAARFLAATPPPRSEEVSRLVASPDMLPRLLRWPSSPPRTPPLTPPRRCAGAARAFHALAAHRRARAGGRAALRAWRSIAMAAVATVARARRILCRRRFCAWRAWAERSALRRRRRESARRYVCRHTLLCLWERPRLSAAFSAWFLRSLILPRRGSSAARAAVNAPHASVQAVWKMPRAQRSAALHKGLARWTRRVDLIAAARHCAAVARAHCRQALARRVVRAWRAVALAQSDDAFLSTLLESPVSARRAPARGPAVREVRARAAEPSAPPRQKRSRGSASEPAAKLRKLMLLSRPGTTARTVCAAAATRAHAAAAPNAPESSAVRRGRALAAFKRRAVARGSGGGSGAVCALAPTACPTACVAPPTAAPVAWTGTGALAAAPAAAARGNDARAGPTRVLAAMGLAQLAGRGAARRRKRIARERERAAEVDSIVAMSDAQITGALAASAGAIEGEFLLCTVACLSCESCSHVDSLPRYIFYLAMSDAYSTARGACRERREAR